jgi:YHS domain-containing protein
MRKILFSLTILIALTSLAIGSSLTSETKKNVTNKKCPVSGGDVSDKYRLDYKGQFVYLCCEGCLKEFSQNPETFVAKLSKDDQEAIKVNELCPVSKEPISRSIAVEFEGRKVYFCCDHCKEKFKTDHADAK